MHVGARYRAWRRSLGRTAADVGGRVGICPTRLSRWENGRDRVRISADEMVALVAALELEIGTFFASTPDGAWKSLVRRDGPAAA